MVRAAKPKPLLNEATDGQVVTRALIKAADLLRMSQGEIAQIIGVSGSTVSRMKDGSTQLDSGSKPYQLAALFLRAWRSLDSILGSRDEAARVWLRSPNASFADARPVDLLLRPEGLVRVCDYLDSRRGRI
ncbi:MAG: antitoxin Xre/MbcA/ParS toxin-binding domain-containing protein [Usitatibacter sp.]